MGENGYELEGFYTYRIAGRDRYYRNPGRHPIASACTSTGGRPSRELCQQPQADGLSVQDVLCLAFIRSCNVHAASLHSYR